MPKSHEERYQEWLERLEIPLENTLDIESLQDYLRDEFDITKMSQVEALWNTIDNKNKLEELGIFPVLVKYPWGNEMRYGIQGLSGLFRAETVKQVIEEER